MQKRAKKFSLVSMAALLGLAGVFAIRTPSFEELRQKAQGSDKILTDREGRQLHVIRTDFKRRKLPWVAPQDFSKALLDLVVLAEDRRFFYHPGVDPLAIASAVRSRIGLGKKRGGSTITMQWADLAQPSVLTEGQRIQKGTWLGKFRQIWGAIGFELRWSKEQILTAYLNEVHLRGEFQGMPAGASAFFNKTVSNLSREEAALLVAMISAPNQNKERLVTKACALLKEYHQSPETCDVVEVASSGIFDRPAKIPRGPDAAPELALRIVPQHPQSPVITTTLQKDLQLQVQSILLRQIHQLREKNVTQSAAIVLDNKTGEVLAYVGNVAQSSVPSQVDGVRAKRQAGSTLKPFLFAKAIDRKLITAASVILDDDTALSWDGGVYRPNNYDRIFHGPISAREALASSLNVPAVKVVTMLGLHETYRILQELQFQDLLSPDYYGVSMALGAVDVQLDTLANAYRMLANKGKWSPLQFVRDNNAETQIQTTPLLSPEASYIVTDILSDPHARSLGFNWGSSLETPFWTAVKTGTSKDYRDNWCVGFSDQYTVAVWAGNFNASGMKEVSGVTGAGPAWADIMTWLHKTRSSKAPEPPSNVVAKNVRHPWQSSPRREVFIAGTEPISENIDVADEQKPQFVFPVTGAKLVLNPHLSLEKQSLFVRFKGKLLERYQLQFNGQNIGKAISPFKIETIPRGQHSLKIYDPDKDQAISEVFFTVQ